MLNPALSVRGERYGAVEGKTPKISVPQARRLLASITAPTPVARRDRAVLAYTASRAGAVAKLRRGDLEKVLAAYLTAAGLEPGYRPAGTALSARAHRAPARDKLGEGF